MNQPSFKSPKRADLLALLRERGQRVQRPRVAGGHGVPYGSCTNTPICAPR